MLFRSGRCKQQLPRCVGVLRSVPAVHSLLQKRAVRCGVPEPEGTQAQQALQQAVDGWNAAQNADAAGKLLFAAANAMRLAGVDAEEALTFASRRFCDACLQQEQRGIQADAPAPIEETK